MTVYAIGTARLSSQPPPAHEPFPGLGESAGYDMTPSDQGVQTSVQEWVSAFPDIPVPTYIYPCTESERVLADQREPQAGSGGEGLWPQWEPLYRRRAVGLHAVDWDGVVRMHPVRGVELNDAQQTFLSSSASWFNPGTGNMAMLVVYRVIREPGAGYRAIVGKGDPEASEGDGFVLGVTDQGKATFLAQGPGYGSANVDTGLRVDDGAWHCSLVGIEHRTSDSRTYVHHYFDVGVGSAADLGDIAVDISPETAFHLGRGEWDAARCHVAYLALWSEVADPSWFGQQSLEAFWTALRAPRNILGEPDERLSLSSSYVTGLMVGGDPDGTGNLVAKTGVKQSLYSVIGDAALDRGGYVPIPRMSNLLVLSEVMHGPATGQRWEVAALSGGAPVVTPNGATDPRGMWGAAVVELDAGGELYQSVLVEASHLTASIWVRLVSADDVGGELKIGEDSGTPVWTTVRFDELSDQKWRRIACDFDVSTATVSYKLRVEASGQTVLEVWGAQLEDEWFPGPYVPSWEFPDLNIGSELSVDWMGADPPSYSLGQIGTVSLKVRLPYTVDQADGRTVLRIQGWDHSETPVDIHVRRDEYLGQSGRILLKIRHGGDLWADVISTQRTGLDPGQSVEDAQGAFIEFGWSFSEPFAWLRVNGTAGLPETIPSTAIVDFGPKEIHFGDDSEGEEQLGAPIYDVQIESR